MIASNLSPSCSILQVEPSQKGAFLESLQPHIYITFVFSSRENLIGLKEVPMWELSQKGWFFDMPQLHQK